MKGCSPNRNSIVRLLVLIFLLVVLAYSCGYVLTSVLINGEGYVAIPDWKPAATMHTVSRSDSFRALWVRPNVYIGVGGEDISLTTSSDKVFLLGSIDIEKSKSVNALDIMTGDLIWKTDPKPLSTLFADQEGLYVGESGGGGRISKFDPDTGRIEWSRFFWYSAGVEHLIVYEDQLHAYLGPGKHRILRTYDGKTMFSLFPKHPPFFDSRVCGEIYQTPIYMGDTIYYRTGRSLEIGEVCAVDIATGNIRWKSGLKVISNVVATDDAVFVLIVNGELLALNPADGEEIPTLKVSFDKPFILYSTQPEVGSYFVAYNPENKILLVYLGDSCQLFAFLVDK